MSLIGHLDELRSRLIISILALFVGMIAGFLLADPIIRIITEPITGLARDPDPDRALVLRFDPAGGARLDLDSLPDPKASVSQTLVIIVEGDPERKYYIGGRPSQQFITTGPLDPIMMKLKVALIMGLLLALPIIIRQIWGFVSPGLNQKERKVTYPILMGSIVLFPLGALFAFFMVKILLIVMNSYKLEGIDMTHFTDFFKLLSLLTTMMLIFGVIFELPLMVAIAARIGLVTPDMLRRYRRHAYVGLAFASMILTPADPFTMLMAFFPLIGLYELSIALAKPMAFLHQRDLKE